jgi:ATP-dependent DNA helicase 2 subunit 2
MVSGRLPVSTHWDPCLIFGTETINDLEEENFSNISILFGLGQYVWLN